MMYPAAAIKATLIANNSASVKLREALLSEKNCSIADSKTKYFNAKMVPIVINRFFQRTNSNKDFTILSLRQLIEG